MCLFRSSGRLEDAGTDVAGGELVLVVYELEFRDWGRDVYRVLFPETLCLHSAVVEDIDNPLQVAFTVDLDEHDKGVFGVVAFLV